VQHPSGFKNLSTLVDSFLAAETRTFFDTWAALMANCFFIATFLFSDLIDIYVFSFIWRVLLRCLMDTKVESPLRVINRKKVSL